MPLIHNIQREKGIEQAVIWYRKRKRICRKLGEGVEGIPAIVALSHPCRRFPMEAAIATRTAPFISVVRTVVKAARKRVEKKTC